MIYLDIINSLGTGILRYALPVLAIIIIFTCIISLFRNRPRLHKLAQLVNERDGSAIDIDRWEISIGKSKSNDIVLSDVGVSRFHAVISKRRKEWLITDTFSRTGVKLNGSEIDGKSAIEDGDIIEIGAAQLRFVCADAISSQSKNQMRNAAAELKNKSNVAYGVLVDVKTHKPIYLHKKDVLIGRGENADIRIGLDTISSEHARIHLTSRGWALTDLNSHNGTKLNGRFITQPQLIIDEDTITFGDRVFVFYES